MRVLTVVGLLFLFAAAFAIYVAVELSWINEGTILEHDPLAFRDTANIFLFGLIELIVGLVSVVLASRNSVRKVALLKNLEAPLVINWRKGRRLILPLVISILVMFLSIFYLSNQGFEIIKGGSLDDSSLWLCNSNATISNGKVYLEIDETEGKQAIFSSVQQGIYPHAWRTKDRINEIPIRNYLEASPNCLFLRIVGNRSEFEFYNETESIVNIGVMMWIQLDGNYLKPISESKQLEVDVNSASYLYGWYTEQVPKPITWDTWFDGASEWELDNDLHYIYSLPADMQMADTNTWDIKIDVGAALHKALTRWMFTNRELYTGTLKSFDIYIEAINGHGSVTIDHVELVFEPKINSGFVTVQSCITGLATFIICLFLTSLYRRLET